ncbi:MAG: hypothetical protein ACRESJ_10105 [Pseudomonas sp.]|uniref:hypothetical protein n=1 Tax=Pseudomonas sp. TaxID=306 RepID=UPI003D6E78BD
MKLANHHPTLLTLGNLRKLNDFGNGFLHLQLMCQPIFPAKHSDSSIEYFLSILMVGFPGLQRAFYQRTTYRTLRLIETFYNQLNFK